MKDQVIVIGGGMSGLAACVELQKTGICDIILIEATEHLGGRIRTVPFRKLYCIVYWLLYSRSNKISLIFVVEEDHFIEMGAQWIHGTKENPLFKLADGLDLIDKTSGI